MRHLLLPLCLLSCLPLAACNRGDEVTVASNTDTFAQRMAGPDVDVNQGKDSVTIEVRDAQMQIAREGRALAMPPDFPEDVYVPAGLVVRNTMAVPRMLTLSGTVSGSAADVFEEARSAMQRQGWREKHVQQHPTMQMLSLEKDGREAVINVMERDGAVQVSYSVRGPRSRQ